jgi:very-short-patch-repair endonuclease
MDYQTRHSSIWRLAGRQHGAVARYQLLELGVHPQAIKHRIAKGRLHRIRRGVYAVGRPQLTLYGRWIAAVLACGSDAFLSHRTAAALWSLLPATDLIEVSTTAPGGQRVSGVTIHRRPTLPATDVTKHEGIPVTTPTCTSIDLAARLDRASLERAINEADKLDLVTPDQLRAALDGMRGRPGVKALRDLLDRHTFTLTESELERRFLPIARRAGLALPQTGRRVNGFKVDFYWPDLGLVVETDGLRYHRTPAEQARDRLREHAHAAAGLTSLRFTHAQVYFEAKHVRETLAAVASQLRAAGSS